MVKRVTVDTSKMLFLIVLMFCLIIVLYFVFYYSAEKLGDGQ
jgi:hypothetical protein